MLTEQTASEYQQAVANSARVWKAVGYDYDSPEYQEAQARVDAAKAQWNKECRQW